VIELLVASNNPGKVREYEQLLAPLTTDGVRLCTPKAQGLELVVHESGTSYLENARIKALAFSRASGLLTLADDSGLEVDALGGEPGVCSARYAGSDASDVDRYRLLLHKLEGVPWERRSARFRCVIVLATPTGETFTSEGVCPGIIALEPLGENGFGYDPVFYLPERGMSMAQLSEDVKNRISHRGRALQAILPVLERVLAARFLATGGC
jgi:XTP/dITP diphosphohydrolase